MTESSNTIDPRTRRRNRFALLGLLAMFVLPILIAGLINIVDKRPAPTRQHGELLQPPLELSALTPQQADGSDYDWEPRARLWRIVVAPPPHCKAECDRLARDIDKVWRLFGKDADRVHVLWVCPASGCRPPSHVLPNATLRVLVADAGLRAELPRADDPDGVPVFVIDPNGFVILRYPPGADLGGLRTDLARLLKLM